METTEKIVEAYVRYIKRWATIPNFKCAGQHEIDLLAIDPVTDDRYHIEVSVSISGVYSKLTDKPFDPELRKQRVHQPGQRMTIGHFAKRKFGARDVTAELRRYGFKRGRYEQIIVAWGWTDDAAKQAKARRITLWRFGDLMSEIAEAFKDTRAYFTDDTLRTLHLFTRARSS